MAFVSRMSKSMTRSTMQNNLQLHTLMTLPSTWILRVANSTPMVDLLSRLNSLRVNRDSKLLFPTPESPISTTGTKNQKCRQRISLDDEDSSIAAKES